MYELLLCLCTMIGSVWTDLKVKYLRWIYYSEYFNKMKLWYVMGVALHFRWNTERCATKRHTPVKYFCKIPAWIFGTSTKPHGGRLLFAIIYCKWRSLSLSFLCWRHGPWMVEFVIWRVVRRLRLLALNRIPPLEYTLKWIMPYFNANWMIWWLAWRAF